MSKSNTQIIEHVLSAKKIERHKKPNILRGILSSARCDLKATPTYANAKPVSDVLAVGGGVQQSSLTAPFH